MKYSVDWPTLKAFAIARGLSIQWFVSGNLYLICAIDGKLVLKTQIPIVTPAPAGSNQADFETNFKTAGNASLTSINQPFSSKILPNGKALYKRITGFEQAVNAGPNTFTWTLSSYSEAKITAIEIINAEIGDNCSLIVLDSAVGSYSGVANTPLNQFGFTVNVGPQFYRYESKFDADIYQGMQVQFVYTSVSTKTIYINLDIDQVK